MSVVLVGNPKTQSRTLEAAVFVAEQITGDAPATVIDIAVFGAELFGSATSRVREALDAVQGADLVVVGSPTYKVAYTGLLKMFLDHIPGNGLAGVVAFPMMLGAGPHHALAPEVFLKPVLVELGATCPTRGLYLLDSDFRNEDVLGPWLQQARRALGR
jgi:FMN reductase